MSNASVKNVEEIPVTPVVAVPLVAIPYTLPSVSVSYADPLCSGSMIAPAITALFAGVDGLYATTAIASVDSYIITFSPVVKSAAFTNRAYPEEYEEEPNGKVLVH